MSCCPSATVANRMKLRRKWWISWRELTLLFCSTSNFQFIHIWSPRKKCTSSNQTILLNEPRSLTTSNQIWLNVLKYFFLFNQIVSKSTIFGYTKLKICSTVYQANSLVGLTDYFPELSFPKEQSSFNQFYFNILTLFPQRNSICEFYP